MPLKISDLHRFHNQVFSNPDEYSEEIIKQCELQKEMLQIYDFKQEEGDKCVEWIEKFCILTEGENAGKPVKLMLFQKWIIHSIFDFWGNLDVEDFDDEGNYLGITNKYVRIVNDVLFMVASGNAKTTLVGFILAYIMYHRKVLPSPKIFIGSNAYRQSRLCFDTILNIIEHNPLLDKEADKRASSGEIEIKGTGAKLIAMSSKGDNYEGIVPAVVVIDETHAMKTSKYADDLRKSTKRSDSLIIECSTDGDVRGGYLDQRKELAHNYLFGISEVKNYRKFFAIFKQKDKKEVLDAYYNNNIHILKKSNPALSKAVSVEMLKEKIVDMINDQSKQVSVLTKNFNIPQNPITSYFTENECRTKEFDESIFYNAPVFLGLDMAYTRNPYDDLTCLEVMVKNPLSDEEYCKDIYFLPKYWEKTNRNEDGTIEIVREDMLKAKSKVDSNILYNPKEDKYGYNLYAKKGDVVIVDEELSDELVKEFGEQAKCDLTGITEDFIIYYIAHLELKYKWVVCKFGLDPNKASKIESICNSSFQSLDGKPVVIKFRMEDKKNSNPIILGTKDIRARKLVYNNNKLSELHFASVQAKEDSYGNITFTNAMRERKDGVIANLSSRSAYNVFTRNKDTGTENEKFLIQWWNKRGNTLATNQ